MERNSKGQFVLGKCDGPKTHGHTVEGKWTKTYSKWNGMRTRCDRKNAENYHLYGGRGISYDVSWSKFSNFLKDMGDCPSGYTLERKDSNKNYSKSNCRWATSKENHRNRSVTVFVEFEGKKRVLAELVELYGLRDYKTTWCNIFKRGWSVKDALLKPLRRRSVKDD